uniref:Peptidase M12B domain-containing protein n=1 Tax=Tetradesmus obliquus TaxID=3088 RepID=A0A383W9W6_TETOB|eukprot:jgi/Sobl393_1/16726/SZX74428.1
MLPSASSKAVLQSVLRLPQDLKLPGTKYVAPHMRTAAHLQATSPQAFTLNFVQVDHSLVATMPQQLQLTLPGMPVPVTAVRRPDVAADATLWVGELVNAPGAYSVVTLVLRADKTITGNVHFVDTKAGKTKSFLITPAIFNTGAGNGDEVSTSSVNADVAAAIAAASSTDTPLHVVVRHQGNPERPECFPGSKPNTQQSEAALAHPRVKKNAKGRAAILRPHRRNHTGRMHGATAIKLGNITAPSAAKRVQTSGGSRRRLLQNMNEHKLLVLYTDDAANVANGEQQLEAQATSAIAILNKAYIDSDVNIVTNMVAFRKVMYKEPTPGVDENGKQSAETVLSAINDGSIANVKEWRDELGADLVTLFNTDDTVGGIAWAPASKPGQGVNDPSSGFSAIMKGAWYGYVLAHEIGHNLGCYHDHGDDWSSSKTAWFSEYAHGYKSCQEGNQYATILSYAKCPDGRAPKIFRFSNPAKRYESGTPLGDSVTANCARKLRESAPLIAAYRPDKPSNTVCKATETQCRDSKGAFKCLAGKVCCPRPYVDECPLGEQCSSTTKTCVSRCDEEAGLFWCPSAKKCISATSCCPDFPDDCPAPYSCPVAGEDCVCPSDLCGCPDGTYRCANTCVSNDVCCPSATESGEGECPDGQECDGEAGTCYDLCDEGYRICNGFCISDGTCCPESDYAPSDCEDPFTCKEWTEFDKDGVPQDADQCICSIDEQNIDACCDGGYKACHGQCIPENTCCTWPETCGYGKYCAEDGTECESWCPKEATFCDDMCYTPDPSVYQGVCCKSAPDRGKSLCKAPFTVCAANGEYCRMPHRALSTVLVLVMVAVDAA